MSKVTKCIEIKPRFGDTSQVLIFDIRRPDAKGGLAIELARHMSMVAGMPDGEDSSGRAKLRIMTPKEVAIRACEMTEELWSEFASREWLMDLPEVQQVEKEEKK